MPVLWRKWQMDVLSNSTSILFSGLKAVFCNFYGLGYMMTFFSNTPLLLAYVCIRASVTYIYKTTISCGKKYSNHNDNKRFISGLFLIQQLFSPLYFSLCFHICVWFSIITHVLYPSKPQIKGALCCFGEEIQTQNLNINNINEVIIKMKKCLFLP